MDCAAQTILRDVPISRVVEQRRQIYSSSCLYFTDTDNKIELDLTIQRERRTASILG